jgi:hypothetical protein
VDSDRADYHNVKVAATGGKRAAAREMWTIRTRM